MPITIQIYISDDLTEKIRAYQRQGETINQTAKRMLEGYKAPEKEAELDVKDV